MIASGRAQPRSRLRTLAQQAKAATPPAEERCELCGETIPAEHRHVLDVRAGAVRCACAACAVLFDRVEAGGGHYRAVPLGARRLVDFDLDDVAWAALDVPVGLAFFVVGQSGEVTAWYPNPLGMTRSDPDAAVWLDLCRANPVLAGIEPEVEALLVYRRGAEPQHWLVPVDVCYRLAALVRRHWEGFTGGPVWEQMATFFDALGGRARRIDRNGAVVPAALST